MCTKNISEAGKNKTPNSSARIEDQPEKRPGPYRGARQRKKKLDLTTKKKPTNGEGGQKKANRERSMVVREKGKE